MVSSPYYDSLASVPNAELSTYLPGRDAAKDAEPIKSQEAKHEGFLWDKKDFSFEDVLDLINPLQHIPLISTMYRESTGDTIGAVPRVLGDALYGGGLIGAAVGAATALVNVAVEAVTGKDVGGTMMALIQGEGKNDGTALAERKADTGTSSSVGSDALAKPAPAVTIGPAKPDNATAADTETLPSPAEELQTFPGVNIGPGKGAVGGKPAVGKAADANAALARTGGHGGAGGAPVGPSYGNPATAATTALPRHPATDNAWVNQSILSGLEKYRAMAREQERQDKPSAGVDALY
ncbi:MAG TPA: hypothetical protein VMV26_05085 [Alphaproteobacteria bacterium]|jgi:hypothetical protein|nr:hypothetical protein [Alphaproteobacteria bacterium]